MSSMTVLGLDSALTGCSVALLHRGALLAERRRPGERGQAETLLPLVEETMSAAGMRFSELDLIAVTIGPGAFTGLRIGIAAAQGLGLAIDRPVEGATTLEAVAAATEPWEREQRTLVVALETKRQDLYLQAFSPTLAEMSAPEVVDAAAFATWPAAGPLLIAGDGATRLAAALPGRDVRISTAPGAPEAARVAGIVAQRHGTAKARPGAAFYLRRPDVTMPVGARP